MKNDIAGYICLWTIMSLGYLLALPSWVKSKFSKVENANQTNKGLYTNQQNNS